MFWTLLPFWCGNCLRPRTYTGLILNLHLAILRLNLLEDLNIIKSNQLRLSPCFTPLDIGNSTDFPPPIRNIPFTLLYTLLIILLIITPVILLIRVETLLSSARLSKVVFCYRIECTLLVQVQILIRHLSYRQYYGIVFVVPSYS